MICALRFIETKRRAARGARRSRGIGIDIGIAGRMMDDVWRARLPDESAKRVGFRSCFASAESYMPALAACRSAASLH
jgi:hypothetical protein